MNDNEKMAIESFLKDIQCLDELKKWESGFNIFDVLKIGKTEIRHSNMLAWLLNPNESHMLGDRVLYNVLIRVSNDLIKTHLLDLKSFEVRREEANIDILLISDKEKAVFAIENKIFSGEHSDQLNRYRNYVEKTFSSYDKYYVFLTPDGSEPSDSENWMILTYRDVYESIEEALSRADVTNEIKAFIDDYLEILRRDIMEDRELKEICNKIYEKHGKALDLIFNNCERGNARLYSGVRQALDELGAEGKINPDEKVCDFYTKEFDALIPQFAEPISSWGTTKAYRYWFEIWGNDLVLHLELGGKNLSEEQNTIMKKIVDVSHPKKKRYEYVYQRIEIVIEKLDSEADNPFDEARKKALSAINKMLDKQKKIIDAVSK